jgi:hypothetical protein
MADRTPRPISPSVMQALSDSLRIAHGRIDPDRISLYSIVRNERFFLPSFFEHYRGLGVNQFVILDDSSTDGSLEFLMRQPDCVVLNSEFAYGSVVRISEPAKKAKFQRAGVLVKSIIPRKFFPDTYAVYADADEFLILPDECPTLPELYKVLAAQDIQVVYASLLEMYPASISDMRVEAESPGSLDELVSLYPFYDREALVEIDPMGQPKVLGRGASHRLFRQHGITKYPYLNTLLPAGLRRKLTSWIPATASVKPPIVRWSSDVELIKSHRVNRPSSPAMLLTLLHFKFNCDTHRKAMMALELKSYAGGSKIYRYYMQLFSAMAASDPLFTYSGSDRFRGATPLRDARLLVWERRP